MVISRDGIADALEQFIRTEFHISDKDRAFSRDVHLYELGFVDSVGFLELTAFIETRYAITLGDEQLFSEKFTSINGISDIVWSMSPCPVNPVATRRASRESSSGF